jgi:tetratricopeptide (TPR) repeat protein
VIRRLHAPAVRRARVIGAFACSILLAWSTAAAQRDDLAQRMRAAADALRERRFVDAVTELRAITELAPARPGGWYALGQAYEDLSHQAIATFGARPDDASWRQLLAADALHASRRLIDAFTLYREAIAQLPSMVTIHDSVVRIYEETDHADWAARERGVAAGIAVDCTVRKALCEFRAGRPASALAVALTQADAESRYWQARAAAELSRAAFKHLDDLPDSVERRAVRAAIARSEERYFDAIAELNAALGFAPGDPALVDDLAASYYAVGDYDRVVATLSPLPGRDPGEIEHLKLIGYSLLRLRRVDEALPVLERAVDRDAADPGPRLALGRARVQHGDFAAAIPLIESQLAGDEDGSLHVQLARAYAGIGQPDKAAALLARSEELRRAANDAAAAAARRTITAPR